MTIDPAVGADLAAQSLELTGRLRLRAAGTSMLPSIRPGALLEFARTDPAAVRPGDVVLVRDGQRFFAHRVRVAGEGFVLTRGDRHRHDDPPAEFPRVLGRAAGDIPDRSRSIAARLLRRSDRLARLVGRLWEER